MTSVGQNPNEASFRDVIRVDEGQVRAHVDELVRASVEETLNGLLDAEADELCGAARYERSADRVDSRAGSYQRKLLTKTGEVKLKVPRLRSLPFETQIIERYRRRESSVEEALVEMYLAGVSVRRVEDITEALWGERVSPSTVSELNQKIYAQIETWRNRPLEDEHAYVFLDSIWLKRSWGGEVKTVAVLVAIGVRADGHREILAVAEGLKEDQESWRGFLRHLKQRGLHGVRLITSDKSLGLVECLPEFFPETAWQRCTVHFYRNVFTAVPQGKRKEVAAMLKAIHAQEDRPAAREKAPGRGRQAAGHTFEPSGRDRAIGPRRNAVVHGVPTRALDANPHKQRLGTDHARDSPANPRSRRVPGRPQRLDAGRGADASHRRHEVGHALLSRHGTTARTRGGRTTDSNGVIATTGLPSGGQGTDKDNEELHYQLHLPKNQCAHLDGHYLVASIGRGRWLAAKAWLRGASCLLRSSFKVVAVV